MIRKILLIQICIISTFGQVIQESNFKLNASQLSSDVINAKEAKTLSPIGKKTHNFTNENLKINENVTKDSISDFPADFMSDEVSDHFSQV
jgi:hypothetical protein